MSITGFFRGIFSFIWRLITWLRVGLANLLFLLVIVVIVAALWPREQRQVPENVALRVVPSGFLVDQYSYVDPVAQVMSIGSEAQGETRVRDVVTAINRAADDPRITSLVLELDELLGGGISKMQEIGNALENFSRSNKPIYAVSDNLTQDQLFLASYADHLIIHPMGTVILTGYSSYRQYYRDALDKLELNMHVYRVGTYKDAVEPYLRDSMSDASKEHNGRWLNELWKNYTDTVEQHRALPTGRVNDFINRLDVYLEANGGDTALAALNAGLVDELADHTEQRTYFRDRIGEDQRTGSYASVDYHAYLALTKPKPALNQSQVGLIVASGIILDGEQPKGAIGSDSLAQLIHQARNDDSIKALVVRVDSGGGSAFASEIIRQELQAARDDGLPVFISMGSIAASGGYWMSMASDQVWATPTTLTGSIGVFSAFPTLENTLGKLGINTDGVGTTSLSDALRLDMPMTPMGDKILQQTVESIYSQFTGLVSNSRPLTREEVDQVGQGRVWTGHAAQELKLVDNLGDLQTVIAAAASAAGLDDYGVVEVERPLTPAEQIAQQLAGRLVQAGADFHSPATSLQQTLATVEHYLAPLAQTFNPSAKNAVMGDPRSVYAQCTECLAP